MDTYEITITRKHTERKLGKQHWAIQNSQTGAYGYAPAIEEDVTEATEIYIQVVDSLNLVAVIAVVNQVNQPYARYSPATDESLKSFLERS